MQELWNRLEVWFTEHAPQYLEGLNEGATDEELNHLEKETQITLPHDLRESLKIHNGQEFSSKGLFCDWVLLSTYDMLTEWQVWKELDDAGEFDDVKSDVVGHMDNSYWWNPKWLPLTANGSGDSHCLDTDSSKKGKVGQIIQMWHDNDERNLIATSYQEWFEKIVTKLENGEYKLIEENEDVSFELKAWKME